MRRVLIVDDDEALLFLIEDFLDASGIDFHIAKNAAQARKFLACFEYAAVVSDLQMPGESGLDLFRWVSSRYPEVRFTLMSGNLDSRVRREATAMGVRSFMEKPFELDRLRRLIVQDDLGAVCGRMSAPAA